MQRTDSIIELNRETEAYVLQAGVGRSALNFQDAHTPLAFIHFSDIHAHLPNWNRLVEYMNHYADYLAFALHTGDYCGGSQQIYSDLYQEGIAGKRMIYNCVGNHDCHPGGKPWRLGEKKDAHALLFNHTENWDAQFMPCEYSMSYYKDFPEHNIRLIVLDDYYDIWETRAWLLGILEECREKSLHVITAAHEPTGEIRESFGVRYHTLDDYAAVHAAYEIKRTKYDFDHRGRVLFEDVIEFFKKQGGVHICHLAGHDHVDQFGLTARGILNVVVQNATDWDLHGDMKRIPGTKSMDCFNVVGVDTDLGLLKIIRIGADVDHYLRKKTILCFDYRKQQVITEA